MAELEDDPVDRRLRAARPAWIEVDRGAVDDLLLERVQLQPETPSRRLRVTVGTATVALTIGVLAGGAALTGSKRSSTADAAVSRAARWFDPPAGTVLHYRSELVTGGGPADTQEVWQSADDPADFRHRSSNQVEDDSTGAIYDPAKATIYEYAAPTGSQTRSRPHAPTAARPPVPSAQTRAGDPTVGELRHLLEEGRASVGPESEHDGSTAVPISYKRAGGLEWILWTRARDGRPLELRSRAVVAGSADNPRVVSTTRWPTYEVIADTNALRVASAHPGAQVVRGTGVYERAEQSLLFGPIPAVPVPGSHPGTPGALEPAQQGRLGG